MEINLSTDVFLTPRAVATLIGVSEKTLRNMRWDRRGPDWVKFGRLIRYRASDIEAFIRTMTDAAKKGGE